ncbi:Sugar phosphate isomerase/epimerase [Pseudarcicella hirudinis]|uniref:Sugar phosphate isomerase/epimerase n=2 Tax=Pseudarcicella hirudinis TaxID=1079859 RepID=A0A1I5Y1G7_9BACT|nr:Sugar phosphate isomerase/epimerase [Pseudarcicella hirudinis]
MRKFFIKTKNNYPLNKFNMSNRREFLKKAGLLGAFAFSKPEFIKSPKFKLGLQLYTLHKEMSADVPGTLKKAASFGYQEVETYSYNYGKNKYYWGLKPAELKQILDDNNLSSSSGHYDLDKFILNGSTPDDMKRYVDDCISGALVLKQDYIVWPWLDPQFRTMEKFKFLSDTLNTIGEQIKKAKLQLAYHNHDFEFIDHNGQIGYDLILKETDPDLVKMEMDLYWFSHSSKLTAHEYFVRNPGRFVCWHIKDMDKNNRDLHTTVGDGTINFKTFFPDAKLAGVKHIFVEQGNNYIPNALDCVERSAKFVKRELL